MGCSASIPREPGTPPFPQGSAEPHGAQQAKAADKGKLEKGVSMYAQWYIEPADAPDDSFSDLIAPTQRDAAATRRASIEFRNRPANLRPEVTRKGLTLRGLRKLRTHIEKLVADGWFKEPLVLKNETFQGVTKFEDLTTTQLVYQWIKAASVSGRERLADVMDLVQPEDVASPSYFISHAWKGRVHKLFDTIESFLHNAADTTAVWIDAVAINQHNDTNREQNLADVGAFEDVVCVCEAGTLVVVDVKRCNPASRAWCVYEWHHTLAFHGPDGLHMHGMTAEQRSEIINNIDVAKASCEYESDHAMIKHNIICHHGSLAAFDTALKLQLLLEPLSYKVDLDQLGRRSVGTRWKFSQVKQWLDKPKAGRALCVLGEPGTGKSSISAAFCSQLLGQREEEPGMWRGPISAVHFLKHSDQRRLDPVSIIKSLTYQIASRLPAAAAAVLNNNDARTVAELRDVDVAFALLLAPALACTREPVFLLIDAIDEGDPPEQQRPDFKGCIMACANKALVLILQHLAPKLPTNVRFLLSSRPDAVGGGIQDILRRRFPDVVFMEPRHLREDGDLPPGQTGRVLMTEAIIKEYRMQGFELEINRTATCGGLEELYSTYAAVFKLPPARRPSSQAAAQRTIAGVRLLLQVLMAAQEPMSHSALQQMGLADFLSDIPGWGVLFYMADHYVYMIHKSISDWLRDPSRSGLYAVDVQAGHRFLGLHFIKEVLKPSFTATSVLPAYTAKYAVRHLCLAGPEVAPLLDVALGQWDFLRKIFEAGQGGRLLQALNIPSERSPYCEDTVRWLGRYMSEFEHKPSDMEAITMQPDTRVPRSFKCQEAASRLRSRIETMVLGGTGSDWSADSCTLKGHSDSVTSVAFSPDGKQLATGSADHNARIWDLSSGHCSVILQEHTDVVCSVAFSPDGKLLATGSWDNSAKLWDLSSGQCINTLKGHDDFVFSEDSYAAPIQGITGISVAFSGDGKQLATGGDDCTSRIWDVHTGQCKMTLRGHTGPIASVAFCPRESKVLATGSWDKTIKIWELTNLGRCKTTLKGHCNPVSCVTFSPCGEKLASGSGAQQVRQKREDKSARIWELSTGHCLMTLAHNDFVASVAFSADGSHVATGSNDETTKVWKVVTGQCSMTLEGHRNPITSVAFSPNTKQLQLATGSTDKTAKLWDLTSEQCSVTPEGHRGAVSSVAFNESGTLLATGSFDGIARTWDLSTGQCRVMLKWPYVPWGHNFMAFDVAFTPDDSRVAVGYSDWTAKIWDLASGSCSYTLEGHTGPVFTVAVSPDGRWLATGSDDTTAKVWDLASRICTMTLEGHTDYVSSVVFSPDGKSLATGAGDCTARVWDLSSGKCTRVIKDAHRDPVSSVAFSPNGKLLATGSYDRTAKLWNVADGKCTSTFGEEPKERISADTAIPLPLQGLPGTSITFSPDGRHLAMGGQDGAKLCDLKTTRCSATLQGHSEAVSSVAFSRDGKLATGSRDRSAKIWEHVTDGSRRMTPPEGSTRRTSISFSPDGKQLGISTSDLVIEVFWDLSNGERVKQSIPHSNTCSF